MEHVHIAKYGASETHWWPLSVPSHPVIAVAGPPTLTCTDTHHDERIATESISTYPVFENGAYVGLVLAGFFRSDPPRERERIATGRGLFRLVLCASLVRLELDTRRSEATDVAASRSGQRFASGVDTEWRSLGRQSREARAQEKGASEA